MPFFPFQCRCIVDAVAGHGDELILRLELPDDAKFLFRADPRIDPHRLDHVGKRLVVQSFEFSSGQYAPVVFQDAQAPGDGLGGARVVAGDHHRRDARRQTVRHRLGSLFPRRVDKGDKAEKRQLSFDCFRFGFHPGLTFKHTSGHGKDPVTLTGQLIRPRQHFFRIE